MSNVCEILSVGTELLLGDIVNTDTAFIAGRLASLGLPTYRQTVVGDNDGRLHEAIREAFTRADILILTGGLGPTCDDITKKAVADYFGVPLVTDEAAKDEILAYFRESGRKMTENNLAQALVPEGSVVFPNHWGSAPGAAISSPDGAKTAILLPGPPSECEPMFAEEVEPYLAARSGYTIRSLNLHLYGIGESGAEAILRSIMEESENPTVAPYACEHEVRIRITARGTSEKECEDKIAAMKARVLATEVGPYCYTTSRTVWESKNAIVLRCLAALREHHKTIACAESCTAGMLSSRIGYIPGASDVYIGSVVSYAYEIKESLLGVPHTVIETYGAVSEECVRYMADGVRRITGAGISVAISGIAGPGGGTEEKPIGTVCFAVSDENGTVTETAHFSHKSDRAKVRRLSTARALMLVIRRLEGEI